MFLVLALIKRNREYLLLLLTCLSLADMSTPPVAMDRCAGYLLNTSWQTLMLSLTVLSRLSIFMVIYEVTSAILTSVRCVQTLNSSGPWRVRQNSLTFLLLQEGARCHLLIFLTCPYQGPYPNYSAAGLIYFGWDFDWGTSPGYVVNILNPGQSLRWWYCPWFAKQ